MLLFLAGCGGGGGGGGGGGLPALVYSGSSSQANVTTNNSSRLAANVFGSSDTVGIIGGTSIEGGAPAPSATGMEGVARTLNHATRRALASASGRRAVASGVAVPFDETEPCELNMGTVRTNGTLDNVTGTGSFTITFNNCLAAGLTLNGSLAAQVHAADLFTCGGIPTNFTANTSRITIRGSGVSVDAGGSLQVLTDIFSFPMATETVINNLINLNNLTGVMTMAENLVSTGTLDFVCTPNTISNLIFTGRIFDNANGFVDVSTPTPLAFASTSQVFPNSGEMLLAGNASGVTVTALSSTRVQLQRTGDSFMALMNWTDLAGPIGLDIGDGDSDGMHNSWETFYSTVNPGDDPDGADGDNLAEYTNGTNPNVAFQ
jgi:hypothetical protein